MRTVYVVPRGRGGRGPAAALQSSVGSELSAQAVANITTTATAISAVAAQPNMRKMTLSNLVFGDKERDQLLVKPAMEAILGIHLSSLSASNSPVRKFNSAAEAMAAYKAGTLKLNDRIEIKK